MTHKIIKEVDDTIANLEPIVTKQIESKTGLSKQVDKLEWERMQMREYCIAYLEARRIYYMSTMSTLSLVRYILEGELIDEEYRQNLPNSSSSTYGSGDRIGV